MDGHPLRTGPGVDDTQSRLQVALNNAQQHLQQLRYICGEQARSSGQQLLPKKAEASTQTDPATAPRRIATIADCTPPSAARLHGSCTPAQPGTVTASVRRCEGGRATPAGPCVAEARVLQACGRLLSPFHGAAHASPVAQRAAGRSHRRHWQDGSTHNAASGRPGTGAAGMVTPAGLRSNPIRSHQASAPPEASPSVPFSAYRSVTTHLVRPAMAPADQPPEEPAATHIEAAATSCETATNAARAAAYGMQPSREDRFPAAAEGEQQAERWEQVEMLPTTARSPSDALGHDAAQAFTPFTMAARLRAAMQWMQLQLHGSTGRMPRRRRFSDSAVSPALKVLEEDDAGDLSRADNGIGAAVVEAELLPAGPAPQPGMPPPCYAYRQVQGYPGAGVTRPCAVAAAGAAAAFATGAFTLSECRHELRPEPPLRQPVFSSDSENEEPLQGARGVCSGNGVSALEARTGFAAKGTATGISASNAPLGGLPFRDISHGLNAVKVSQYQYR